MSEIYANGLTKKEYYRYYEWENREMRNAYRRERYRQKCVNKLLDKDKKDTI